MTLPTKAASICSGATPERSSAPRAAVTPRSVAVTLARPPVQAPTGVRAPSRMTRALPVAMPDYVQMVVLPALSARVAAEAPNATLRVISTAAHVIPDALARGEVGKVGVPISNIEDMSQLFDEIPLDQMNSNLTINATAAWLLSLYIAVAERRGISRMSLSGTTQNDIIKEYLSRGT